MILAVSRWKDVFEKSDLRKCKNLTWISCPVSFQSTGYQTLLDEFDGITAAALYGAWQALCQVAAAAPIRGQLSGQKGEPYTPGRLARLSGLPAELFDKLLPWALRVGWLVAVEASQMAENIGKTPIGEPSGELPGVPGDFPDYRTGQDKTGHNRTGQDRTGQETRSPARPGPVSEDSGNAGTAIAELIAETPELQQLQTHRIAPDPTDAAEMTQSVFFPLKASDVASKSPLWWAANWYKRQLAAPDPVLRGSNAAEAAVVVALALSLAKLPDAAVKKSRTSMFIAMLTKGTAGLRTRAAPFIPAAVELLRKQLEKQTAAEVA
jgi:hypothetical protein